MIELNDFRCKDCGKLLGKINGQVEIMCPRCGGINSFIQNRHTCATNPKYATKKYWEMYNRPLIDTSGYSMGKRASSAGHKF